MSMLAVPQVAAPTNGPSQPPTPSYYNCDFVGALPYGGAEILLIASVFMLLCVNFAVSFLAVTAKQLWPSALDPVVANRLALIQRMFPGLGSKSESGNSTTSAIDSSDNNESTTSAVPVKTHTIKNPTTGEDIMYDAVCAPEAYIAGKSVDEDLVYILANNQAFGTVSSYCSSTVRGYAMLSTMLYCAGMILSFMCIHNMIVDPTQGKDYGTFSLIGYSLCFFTATIMCGPNGHAVFRNANIFLTTNIPQYGAPDKMEALHGIGIVCFCLVPTASHLLYALKNKDTMPNYAETISGITVQISGAVLFGLFGSSFGRDLFKISKVTADKLAIAFEVVAVFASFLAFVNYEYYATAACAGHVTAWHSILVGCMFAPFALVARHFCWAPTEFTSPPALLLMNNGQPVATSGPCPAVAFDAGTFPDAVSAEKKNEIKKDLPHIQF